MLKLRVPNSSIIMKYMFLLLAMLIIITPDCFSQEKSAYEKFGKISVSDLERKNYKIDSSANAVVLSDICSVSMEGNTRGWFSLITKRHKVIHILNKNGYDEANIQIPIYVSGNTEEKVSNLKAVTYNLENGKIIQTKLEKSNQFIEVASKYHKILKFTFPQVKEGSIIEFQYDESSDFISVIDPWYFQSLTAPTLWSEMNFSVPEFFEYNVAFRGYLGLTINEKAIRNASFTVVDASSTLPAQRGSLESAVTDYRWVIKNVPELKTENFTSSIRNHISRIDFQLSLQKSPLTYRNYRTTWEDATKDLLASESFGLKLNAANNWMYDDVKPLYEGITDKVQKAYIIFKYVRDNFKCDGAKGVYMSGTLKSVFKSRKGSVAEVNLLLTAMLRFANLEANPVLISTRANGYATEYTPILNTMNYVVVQFVNGEDIYYLDATQPRLGFNKLPLFCFNGYARVVDQFARPVYFNADNLKETKKTTIFIINQDDGKIAGALTQNAGDYESFLIREEITESGKENFFKDIRKKFESIAILSNEVIDSLQNLEAPIIVKYNLEFNKNDDDILYVNPTMGQGYSKNPFSASERNYPVEMPYTLDELIHLTMEVPKGYAVDELPKQTILKFDEEGNSFFEYRITQSKNTITFYNRIKLDKAFYLPEDYSSLREFFSFVVKKQSEQIVFKKVK